MNFLRNLRVRTKFIVLVTISLIASMMIGTYATTQTSSMADDMEIIYEEKFIPNGWISDAIQTNLRIDSILIQMMFIDDLAEKQQLKDELNNGVDSVLANFAIYEAMELSDEERQQVDNFYTAVDTLTAHQDKMIELAVTGNNDAAYEIFLDTVKQSREELVEALYALNEIKRAQTEEISTSNIVAADKTGSNIVYFMIFVAFTLVGLGIIFVRTITVPIRQLVTNIQAAQEGDFTKRATYESKDELGVALTSFNEMLDTLQKALNNIQQSAHSVDDNASNLSANIQQSGASTEHVVSAIQEITAGSEDTKIALEKNAVILEGVTASFGDIQTELGNIETIASQSLAVAKEGAAAVSENVSQMEKIQGSITDSNRTIEALSDRVSDVDNILKDVNSISEQTNLLALNAAIEAARAGEHGKGFAVVADEVRKLAEQSLQSTKSISEILSRIKLDTKHTVENMSVVLDEANKGLTSTHVTADKFNEIYVGTTNIAPLISQLATTVEEMDKNLQVFVGSASKILDIAVSNAANCEEVSASAEQQMNATVYMQQSAEALANVASDLNGILQQFKIK